jgi:hypothetical protein
MQEKFQEMLMDSKDVRMKATSEILRNMRILKLQGWEMRFLSKIVELRKTETSWLKKYCWWRSGLKGGRRHNSPLSSLPPLACYHEAATSTCARRGNDET